MYLKGNLENLERDLAYAREEGFILGAKVVRGAYIYTETQVRESAQRLICLT